MIKATIEGDIKEIEYLINLWKESDKDGMIRDTIVKMSIERDRGYTTIEIVRKM